MVEPQMQIGYLRYALAVYDRNTKLISHEIETCDKNLNRMILFDKYKSEYIKLNQIFKEHQYIS
jgi:hypothetical protein